jgi:WhiB family redox-sensing transcriptional regulator
MVAEGGRRGLLPELEQPTVTATDAERQSTGTYESTVRGSREAMTVADAILLHGGAQEELSWQERALCAQTDPEAFFPEKGGSTREAKKVCMVCEVRAECLAYALEHDERFGIWGGMSERERRRLRRRAVS